MKTRCRFSSLAGASLLLGASLLSSCNRGPQEKRIAFIPKGQAHVFWQSVHAGAIKAARENPGFSVIWNGPASETDYTGQIKIVDAALNQNVDAICLAPIDKKILVTLVERAAAIGKPMIIFDSGVDTDTFTSQVATDNTEGGRMAARRLAEVLGKKGKVVEVAVQPGSASTMDREQGFESTLKDEFPDLRMVDKQYGMADFAKSLKVAENMLTAVPDLDGMFGSNESSSVGAVRALQSQNRKNVKLVGFDSSPQLLEALKSGEIDALIVQDPFEMGYRSMIAAITKLKGGNPDHIQNIAPTLVTRENMDSPEIQKKINPDLKTYLETQK
jgi:ribose transport system substrate-binding protein